MLNEIWGLTIGIFTQNLNTLRHALPGLVRGSLEKNASNSYL
jgi:hypothetical protein